MQTTVKFLPSLRHVHASRYSVFYCVTKETRVQFCPDISNLLAINLRPAKCLKIYISDAVIFGTCILYNVRFPQQYVKVETDIIL